jgi:hypothetical protein
MERIISRIESIFRPTAKALIKGGIVLASAVSEFASESGEQFKDLLAEAKAEVKKPESQEQKTGKSKGVNGSRRTQPILVDPHNRIHILIGSRKFKISGITNSGTSS